MAEVVFTIKPGGRTSVEANGFTGSECKSFTEAYEKALGGVEAVEEKPEFHMKAEEKTAQKIGRA